MNSAICVHYFKLNVNFCRLASFLNWETNILFQLTKYNRILIEDQNLSGWNDELHQLEEL